MKIDDVDEKIIEMLKKDSRTTNGTIAKEIKLTEGAVRHRIQKLVAQGTIAKFTIDVSTKNNVYGLVMLKAVKSVKDMMKDLSQSGIAKESYEISGDFDGCAILEGSSLEEIDKKVDDIRSLKSVADTKTMMSFKKY